MEDYVDVYKHDEHQVFYQISKLPLAERDRIARLYGYPSYKRWSEVVRDEL